MNESGDIEFSYGFYSGEIKNGMPNGKGILRWFDDDRIAYNGEWRDGKRCGNGILSKKDGRNDVGFFVNDFFVGKVSKIDDNGLIRTINSFDDAFDGNVRIVSNGTIYEGQWSSNGLKNGYGVLRDEHSKEFKGFFLNGSFIGDVWGFDDHNRRIPIDFVNGKYSGKVHISYSNGDTYLGNWVDGERTGFGHYHYSNGNEYEGQWKNGRMCGHGKLTLSNGYSYDGNFLNDKYDGYGELFNKGRPEYEGIFKNGMMSGKGTFYHSLKCYCTGNWINDSKEGIIEYHFENGSSFIGSFINDSFSGEGTYQSIDGGRYCCIFNGKDIEDVGQVETSIDADAMYYFAIEMTNGLLCNVRSSLISELIERSAEHGSVLAKRSLKTSAIEEIDNSNIDEKVSDTDWIYQKKSVSKSEMNAYSMPYHEPTWMIGQDGRYYTKWPEVGFER